jgi:hypothetical protein
MEISSSPGLKILQKLARAKIFASQGPSFFSHRLIYEGFSTRGMKKLAHSEIVFL